MLARGLLNLGLAPDHCCAKNRAFCSIPALITLQTSLKTINVKTKDKPRQTRKHMQRVCCARCVCRAVRAVRAGFGACALCGGEGGSPHHTCCSPSAGCRRREKARATRSSQRRQRLLGLLSRWRQRESLPSKGARAPVSVHELGRARRTLCQNHLFVAAIFSWRSHTYQR